MGFYLQGIFDSHSFLLFQVNCLLEIIYCVTSTYTESTTLTLGTVTYFSSAFVEIAFNTINSLQGLIPCEH
jgi:hypothetical protein